jgi:hypothetical protein
MTLFRRQVTIVLGVLYLLALPAISQTFRGSISGTITDSSGAALVDAVVQAVNGATGLHRNTVTSSAGEFTFQDLPLGDYEVTATHPGFDTLKLDKVTVEVGKVTSLQLTLKVAGQTQTVEVAATAAAIETNTSTLNAVVPDRAVQDVPLNGRDFTQLVKLAPGVNGAGSLNGTRTAQNNWQIDGADNNDLWHNAAAVNQGGVSGVAGTLLPIEAIDQFSVQSNANAESGRNGGGSINMVIKSGTNSLHGSLYYFNRNDALAANTPFAPAGSPKPKLKNNQFGGSVGGPIVKNKLFYFLTYERQKLIVGNGTGATEPSAAWVSQATAVLQQYGVPVSPVSTNLLSFWPQRGRTGPATSPNFFSTDDSVDYSDNGIAKIDYIIDEKNNLAFRWFVGTGAQTAPVGSPYHEYYQVAPSRMQNYSLVYNKVITPRLVNQLLAGVNYFLQTFNDFDTSFNPVAAGLNTGITNPTLLGAPNITINGFDAIGLTPPLGRIDTTGHLNENLTYTTGRHELRVGGEYRHSRLDVFYERNARGTFTFDGSQGPWASDPSVTSNTKSLADYLAGFVQSSTIVRGDLQRNYYMNAASLFAQDSFKISQHLTLNYGLRWEYFGPFYDPTNRISVFIPSKGGIVFTGGNGLDSLYPRRWDNVAPRFGFAYTPKTNGRLVIRGNYGVYYDSPNLNAFGDNRPPNSGATGVLSNPAGPSPVFSLTRSNYTIVSGQPVFGDTNVPPPPYGVFSVDQNFKNASIQNFTTNVQYQVSRAIIAEVGYVGSLGHHLLTVLDINQPPTSRLGTSATRAAENALRPFYGQFPQFATINQVESVANSHFNGMIATLRAATWHRLTAQLSYTLGHSLDEESAVRGVNPTNSYDLHYDYGNSDFDVRHTFTSYLVYNLPTPSSAKLLLGGWQLNSLLAFHTGQPFTVRGGKNYSGTFEGRDRVDIAGNPFQGVSHALVNGYVQWLNPSAFNPPAAGSFGNEPRNQFYGPGFANVDLSAFKNTPITDRVSTQFRVEMFNLFNRRNYPNPNTTLSSGSFGRITDTIGDSIGATGIGAGEPFNVQLALKIIF